MICRNEANFPYPLLTNCSKGYKNPLFDFNVNLKENNDSYGLGLCYTISSKFINYLLERGLAELILVTDSKDNGFYNIDIETLNIEIKKSRLSLNKKSKMQLIIKAKGDIQYKENDDLDEFYNDFKENILIPKSSVLGFSNIIIFDSSIVKPLQLFEKKLDPDLTSAIKIELGNETIIIHYKNESLQFKDSSVSNKLNNHYVYMGLQKALYKFITNNKKDDEESVNLNKIDVNLGALDLKLYNLMKSKMIEEINYENIDEVIGLISDRILEKHVAAIRGLYNNEGD